MKKVFIFICLALIGTSMVSCSNEGSFDNEVLEPHVESSIIESSKDVNINDFRNQLISLNDSLQLATPSLQTRGFWKWIYSVVVVDAVCGLIGNLAAGPAGAAVAAATGSAYAAKNTDREMSSNDPLIGNGTLLTPGNTIAVGTVGTDITLGTSTANYNNIGVYHNKILQHLGNDALKATPTEELDSVVIRNAEVALDMAPGTLDTEMLKHNEDFTILRMNIENLMNQKDADSFYGTLNNMYSKYKDEISVLREYMRGLESIDDSNGKYTQQVLNLVDSSKLNSNTKVTIMKSVRIANASSNLWVAE